MKIAVALCTYNGSKYLEKQIDSLLNQKDYFPDEIIICDDISTDETLKIVEQYKAKHPNIFKIYSNTQNLGSTRNFEKAIALTSADFIFLSDQDDIWKPNKIKTILEVFEKNPKAEGVFSNGDLINGADILLDKNTTIWDSIFFLEKELAKPIDFFDVISKNGNIVTGATLCIKKETKDFIFPFSNEILHDEWIANLLSLRNSLFYSTENLISYRIHDNQQVGMKNRNKIQSKNRLKRIILGLEEPSTFIEYRHLYKKKYLSYSKATKYKHFAYSKINLDQLIKKSLNDFHDFNSVIKKKFPVKYYITSIIDKLRNKRK